MKEPLLAKSAGFDVAVVVEDDERVATCFSMRPLVRQASGGEDVVVHSLRKPRSLVLLIKDGISSCSMSLGCS